MDYQKENIDLEFTATDSSISFAQNPFKNVEVYTEINKDDIKLNKEYNIRENDQKIFGNKIFFLPRKIYNLKEKETAINFNYEILEGNTLIIRDLETKNEIKIKVFEFPNYTFFDEKFCVMLDRKKYEKKIKREENQKYKKSIELETEYIEDQTLSNIRKEMLNYQLREGKNFYFIDSFKEISLLFDSLLREKKGKKLRAVKKIGADKNTERFKYCLSLIPGVSKNISESIQAYYVDLKTFLKTARTEDYREIRTDAGVLRRNIWNRIYKSFFSTDGSKKLADLY